jgi:drug/metabolite transporter (DMT)-like permease
LNVVRVWLPAAIAAAGVALLALGGDAGRGAGVVLIGVAALVVLVNLLARLSVSSERDREREEEQRRYFSSRGRWPDDEPP